MNLKEFIEKYSDLIEENLTLIFNNGYELPVIEDAMKYSLLGGGKRLRPLLAIMTCQMFDGSIEEVMPYACSIEMIHTYSLIHDDLPAMDNDDYRRGKLSNHKVYGEGFAILAGDALLNTAYEILLNNILNKPTEERIKAAYIISKAAGLEGMLGGQAMDLYYENRNIEIERLDQMHRRKTGALIKASLEVGAILSKAEEDDIRRISIFGENLGKAYQISDDILDVIGSQEKMGKTIGKDAKSNKSTYVKHFGINQSKKIMIDTVNDAKKAVEKYGSKANLLIELADFVAYRDK
ncbi:MAG TPA: polyprenyl synthetase family protein [Clostridiales bacterium]|nr:polyprenyl synthetase family protein [Clostridiales bacterium]